MLPIGWFVVAVVLAILLTMWVTFTLTRLDRLHARVDAAEAALDAQLVRRAVAVGHLIDASGARLGGDERDTLGTAAQQVAQGSVTDRATSNERQVVENTIGRAVTTLLAQPAPLDPAAESELREAAARVLIARRFYNDAVRDTRSLRGRRMPRLLHLAGHRAQPEFFDIDDTLPPTAVARPPDATLDAARTPDERPLDEHLKEDR